MSLFDVIKYPIGDNPTVAELSALPAEIYTSWCRDCLGSTYSPYFVSGFFSGEYTNKDSIIELRRRIRDYEPL